MGLHEEVENFWRGMMKNSAYIKFFRHQCTMLVKISRYFSMEMNINVEQSDAPFGVTINQAQFMEQFDRLQKFLRTSDNALEVVRNISKSKNLKEGEKSLEEAKDALKEYVQVRATVGRRDDSFGRPLAMMEEAQRKDGIRAKQIISLESIKKVIPGSRRKLEVPFCIHDGGGHKVLDLTQKICEESTIEEVIFKFSRVKDPATRIEILDNASFYINFKNCSTIAGLGMIEGEGYKSRKATESLALQAYLKLPGGRHKIHVLVDRNPRVQVLLGGTNWARLFSLSKLDPEDSDNTLMKDIGGELHHSHEAVQRFVANRVDTGLCKVYQLDTQMRRTLVVGITDPAGRSWLTRLQSLHSQIVEMSICPESRKLVNSQWLIQLPNLSLPSFLHVEIPPDTPQGSRIASVDIDIREVRGQGLQSSRASTTQSKLRNPATQRPQSTFRANVAILPTLAAAPAPSVYQGPAIPVAPVQFPTAMTAPLPRALTSASTTTSSPRGRTDSVSSFSAAPEKVLAKDNLRGIHENEEAAKREATKSKSSFLGLGKLFRRKV